MSLKFRFLLPSCRSRSGARRLCSRTLKDFEPQAIPLLRENVDLKPYNTFRIDAQSRYFAVFGSEEQLLHWVDVPQIREHFLVLGGGSNLLFCKNFEGTILKNEIEEFSARLAGDSVFVTLGAGNSWHDTVTRAVTQGFYGIENLALIPGSVGAAPVQNIGAYGVELKDVLHSVRGYNLLTNTFATLTNADCRLGYRDSIFKRELKNRFIITSVVLRLSTQKAVQTEYAALKSYFESHQQGAPTPQDVYAAVCSIRREKLPDPDIVGNAGSFFKNPLVPRSHFSLLQQRYADMPFYTTDATTVKVPAAYLIEKAGFKGAVRSSGARKVGVHEKQALVIVNRANATGAMVYDLAQEIRGRVKKMFSIELEIEVNVVN